MLKKLRLYFILLAAFAGVFITIYALTLHDSSAIQQVSMKNFNPKEDAIMPDNLIWKTSFHQFFSTPASY